MAIDLYLRIPTDPKYDGDQIEINDQLELFLQQIEMILTTRKGTVLGDPNFGANLEQFVWSNHTSSEIENRIHQQISLYCGELGSIIPYSISVQFIKGDIIDSVFVNVDIDGTAAFGVVVS